MLILGCLHASQFIGLQVVSSLQYSTCWLSIMNNKSYKKIKLFLKKIYQYRYRFFGKKLHLLNRHQTYDDYVNKQKEKTLDPNRIKIWMGKEWDIKLDGFRKLFERNSNFLNKASNCICLGARTGQEVKALRELGKEAIGVDLVEFPPFTVEGDIHNLNYLDKSFDFVFTNIFDHSLYPDKFISEMERICQSEGYIVINLQVNTPGDDYSENIINDASEAIKLFKHSKEIVSRSINNSFDEMNWEIVMQKIKL